MIEMLKVRQVFQQAAPFNLEAQIRSQLAGQEIVKKLRPGQSVGIAVGSRGIEQIDTIIMTLVKLLKEQGACPSIFAAMGSHGGEETGQLEILRHLNISQEKLGVPVIASSSCQLIDNVNGLPVFVNSLAQTFDWIVPVNRVKPHTSFSGPIESGLTKMLAVGLGGPRGAGVVHSKGSQAIPVLVEEIGRVLIERLPIIFGVAVVEDKSHRINCLRICQKEKFIEVDKALLVEARRQLPMLPFEEIDVLIVDQMGKCFSGTGMDTNVLGRFGIKGVPDKGLRANYIVVLDLAEESNGNANGIGLADITTARLVRKIDYSATLKNVLTTSFLDRAKIPVTLPNDKEAIETALGLLSKKPEEIQVVHIANTLELEEFYISPCLAANSGLEVMPGLQIMNFDKEGNLTGYIAHQQ